MLYRGYHLESKALMVGWQVTITRNDAFIRHTAITRTPEAAVTEARTYIDTLPPPPQEMT